MWTCAGRSTFARPRFLSRFHLELAPPDPQPPKQPFSSGSSSSDHPSSTRQSLVRLPSRSVLRSFGGKQGEGRGQGRGAAAVGRVPAQDMDRVSLAQTDERPFTTQAGLARAVLSGDACRRRPARVDLLGEGCSCWHEADLFALCFVACSSTPPPRLRLSFALPPALCPSRRPLHSVTPSPSSRHPRLSSFPLSSDSPIGPP